MHASPSIPTAAEAFNTHHLVRALVPATPPLPPRHPRLAPDRWLEIAARAEHESLRDLAAAYGVSHETIRAIIRRVRTGTAAALVAD